MASFRNILILFCFALALGWPLASSAVAAPADSAQATAITQSNAANREAATSQKEEQSVSPKATVIARIGPFPITNSMILTWIAAILVIVFSQISMRKHIKSVPSGLQNFWEWLVESLYNFLQDLVGHKLMLKTFWFFATIFIFIVSTYWISLVPGVGTIGYGHWNPQGDFHIDKPLFRGSSSDLNMTLAMALLFFAFWIIWALQEAGPRGIFMHIFAPKVESKGIVKVIMWIMFFVIGCLEVISIIFRPVSLSFRLYGNAYAGESLLEMMSHVSHWFSWLIPIPIYFLEVLVGLVQALVFMLLCAVFTFLICHDEDEHNKSH